MSGALTSYLALVAETLRDPRQGARRAIGWGVPDAAVWQALLLVVVLGMLQTFVYDLLLPPTEVAVMAFRDTPLLTTAVAFLATAATVVATHRIGLVFGGKGSFAGALRVTVWLQAVLLLFNLAQIALHILIPPLAVAVGLFNIVLMIWLMTNFVAELHGFKSLAAVLVVLLITGFVLGFALMLVLTLLGFFGPLEVPDV